MYKTKRKTFFLIISAFISFAIIISVFIFQKTKQKNQSAPESNIKEQTVISSIISSMNTIIESFDKSLAINNFEQENIKIYANALSIKNLLFLLNYPTTNTVAWFTELQKYTEGDMSDTEYNKDLYFNINEATSIMINGYNDTESAFEKLESHFTQNKPKEYYKGLMSKYENQYAIFSNVPIATRREISLYAQQLLNFPHTINVFNGIYTQPYAVSYKITNSYAQIYPSGKTLGRMADDLTKSTDNTTSGDYLTQAKKLLSLHAPYAERCSNIFVYKNSDTIYYIFCPELNINNQKVYNISEKICIGIKLSDCSMSVFDATEYLKKHKTLDITKVSINDTSKTKDQSILLKGYDIYHMRKSESYSGNAVYILKKDGNETKLTLNEFEYLNFLNKN